MFDTPYAQVYLESNCNIHKTNKSKDKRRIMYVRTGSCRVCSKISMHAVRCTFRTVHTVLDELKALQGSNNDFVLQDGIIIIIIFT